MKHLSLIAAATLALGATHVYAADMDVAAGPNEIGTTLTLVAPAAGQAAMLPTIRSAPMGKTREEVRQELIRAQKDGTMERLNALYGGG
ncbi:DUF4148 domain-containing protein [Cupriavidus pinatubonensis]|uniref:Uncharacterized protein n=1 Tax=Cupriavidus pinatubonensis TaxID=248026 RepID=A0ABN7ZUM6_9BURK|nr:DUF4148 domain-containing protein [Cupriavidus pinatubonensis]CAG9187567.1 hypothetical protein LMG23994_07012 [Cupriavidus pinatubonensis]